MDEVKKRKPPRKVCEFSIVIDTREQLPWLFTDLPTLSAEWVVSAVRGTLSQGDYAIAEHEELIVIERKSLQDLYGTLSGGRDRFARELERISDSHRQGAVIVEAPWDAVLHPEKYVAGWRSNMRPQSVVGTIQAAMIRHPRVHWACMPSRKSAEWMAFQLMRFAYKMRDDTQWEPLNV